MSMEGITPYCGEFQRSRLWSGRMCWNVASYACKQCGKPVCLEHKRELRDGSIICLTCAGV
jgi:hypothetical protein